MKNKKKGQSAPGKSISKAIARDFQKHLTEQIAIQILKVLRDTADEGDQTKQDLLREIKWEKLAVKAGKQVKKQLSQERKARKKAAREEKKRLTQLKGNEIPAEKNQVTANPVTGDVDNSPQTEPVSQTKQKRVPNHTSDHSPTQP